jgi:pSer/pThr/pTyr-binding forkhead associated (FHA) protein
MSGKHGSFEITSTGTVVYTDHGSTNGSFLNNNVILKTQVKINDKVRIGNTIVVIDEKRLSNKEKLIVGKSVIGAGDLTMAMPTIKGTKSLISDSKKVEETKKENEKDSKDSTVFKKSVILNQELKKKASKSNWVGNEKEKLIEQEESSGNTKLLKLDIVKKAK